MKSLAVLLAGALLVVAPTGCISDDIPARPVVDADPVTASDGGGVATPDADADADAEAAGDVDADAGLDLAEDDVEASSPPDGSVPGVEEVLRGAGCGQPLPPQTVATVPGSPKGYTQYQVMTTGATLLGNDPTRVGPRSFWVRVPADYDPNHPYRVVYLAPGCGTGYSASTATFPLFREAQGGTEEAIYVAVDVPTVSVNQDCFDNRAGAGSEEWEAFQLFQTFVDSHYCVDDNRVYVAGYSTGGWLANMWGCYFAGDGEAPASDPTVPRAFAPRYHVRAEAAVASGEPANDPRCNGPAAAIWLHDIDDAGNPIAGAYDACARALRMNGCVNTTRCEDPAAKKTPWHHPDQTVDVCFQYDGCPADYPVVFCTTTGLGHSDNTEIAVPAFSTFFNLLNPPP